MKIAIHIVLILSVTTIMHARLHAQPKFYFSTGIGDYAMGDLKYIQSATGVTPALQVVSNFPAYFNYESGLYIGFGPHSKLLTALSFGYGSTGGRATYSDYSGYVTLDQKVSYLSVGTSIGVMVHYLDGKLVMMYEVRPGVIRSNLNLHASQEINGSKLEETENYTSVNAYLQPTVTATRRYGNFGIDVYAGYNFNYRFGKVESKESSGAYLAGPSGAAKIDWSGFRLGIGVSAYFKRPSRD